MLFLKGAQEVCATRGINAVCLHKLTTVSSSAGTDGRALLVPEWSPQIREATQLLVRSRLCWRSLYCLMVDFTIKQYKLRREFQLRRSLFTICHNRLQL